MKRWWKKLLDAIAAAIPLVLLCSSLASAQDHTMLVAMVKQDLIRQNVDLSGACGAFQITKRVAWALRSEGYGLLGGKSSAQNGCAEYGDKFAVDWLLKADGHGIDILSDAGGANGPTWGEEEASASLYRPAFDPGDVPPTPAPIPVPVPPVVDLKPLQDAIAALQYQVAVLQQNLREADERFASRISDEQAARTSSDAGMALRLDGLKVPTGCKVQFLSCRLVMETK